MSCGEKKLIAFSMLLAISEYRPGPFRVLDEVAAPLEQSNIGRVANAVCQSAAGAQPILVTFSKRAIEHS